VSGVGSTEPRGWIELRDVFRVHATAEGDAAALQGLSLTIREGEVVVVLGPSGSGKTTLLRILAGFDRPSAGVVRVFGHDVARLRPRELADYRTRTIGYVDQHYARSLAAELPARELVALRLGLDGVALFGALGGIVTGVVLSALVLDLVRVTANLDAPQPPLVLAVDWRLVGLGAAGYVLLAAATIAIATGAGFRPRAAGRYREVGA
jgi:hypothetical protein